MKEKDDIFNTFFSAARTLFSFKTEANGSIKLNLFQVLAVIRTLTEAILEMYDNIKDHLDTDEDISELFFVVKQYLDMLNSIQDISCYPSIRFRLISDREIEDTLRPIPKEITQRKDMGDIKLIHPRKFQAMFFSGLNDCKTVPIKKGEPIKKWNKEFNIHDVRGVSAVCLDMLHDLRASLEERTDLSNAVKISVFKKTVRDEVFINHLRDYYMQGN